jgi:hypothetical protein
MSPLRTVILLAAVLICCSCSGARPRAATGDELEIVAWYVEDVAHGIDRRPEELLLVDGSQRMQRIAEWALGSEIRGQRAPPRLLLARRNRMPLLASAMRQDLVVLLPDSGLLAPKPGLDREEREVAEALVDSENHDRRAIDAIVLAMADAPEDDTLRFMRAAHAARIELDPAAGAVVWRGSATPAALK